MSEQVNYQELEQLVNDQPRVHGTAFYQDARPRTQKIYDQTIQMGWDILADRNTAQPSPQTMVDMAVQSINTAIKALKSNPVLSASTPKLPKPNSVRSEVRPAEAVASTASDQSSTTSSAPASAHEQPTQTTAAESGQLKADAHTTTNSTADPAPATAPTTPQPTIAPSQPATAQPTEVTQPTADGETHSDQLGTQATAAPSAGSESVAAESATPDTAASQETAAAATGSTASEKSASAASELTTAEKAADNAATAMSSTPASDAAPASQTAGTEKKDPSTNKKRNLPMVVRQKPNWHLLPQAIWRGLQWTLGSKTVLKTK